MATDTTGEWWTGDNAADLAEYIEEFSRIYNGYPTEQVVSCVCADCGGRRFRITADGDEGVATRTCVTCNVSAFIADSAEHADEAELVECACPCGGEEFEAAAGFAFWDDGDVKWICLGLRCVADGVLGVYTSWKIDYAPSGQLLSQV